ncbi:hypothetical protein D1AOALGA4SA_3614 [Olavius algarvensis Delta 1 endosymbiont]|nr:hypothetical protein D1AOALGA4SA_3614 [Olavius algarvensis Delta 1 endosymbiont]
MHADLKTNRGTIRDTFAQHQLKSAGLQLRMPEKGDFLV